MRAHGSLHMHQCSYNSQGYTGRATHLFNPPSHPGSLHSDPTGVQVGHDQAKTLTQRVGYVLIRAHHNKPRETRSRQLLRFRNRTRPAEKADLHTETTMAAVLRWLRSDLPLQSPSYPLRKTAERQEQARIVEFPVYLPRTSRDMSQ